MPTKHTNFSKSILGFGGYILSKIDIPLTIDELWIKYQNDYQNKIYYAHHSIDQLILAIIFLYSIGVVEERDGTIQKCI